MMLKPYWLRFHRWITLVFALPLLALILSGLVLSLEPLAQRTRPAAPVTEASVLAALQKFDPEGTAAGLTIRTYDQLMTLNGVGPDGSVDVSLRTGEEIDEPGWAQWFGTARQLHERLLLDLGWLVTTSPIAMLMLASSIPGRSVIKNAAPVRRAHPRFAENIRTLGAQIEWVEGD